MNTYKKIICFSLAFAIIITSFFAIPVLAKNDIDGLEKLRAFGIVEEDDTFDEYITRAEFIHYSICLLGVNNISFEGNDNPFTDVPNDNAYLKEIILAYQYGLISCGEDKSFRPDDPISVYEVSKIVVSLLGYEEQARYSGGYPQGYYLTANDKKIFKGCRFDDLSFVSPENFVKIIENVLDANFLTIKGFTISNPPDVTYGTTEGKERLMEYNLGIYKESGIVNSNTYTSITKNSGVGDGKVEVDNIIYNVGNTDISSYIGYRVEFYYKEESDNKTIVYFEVDDKNKITEITAKNIISDMTTTRKITYSEGEKTKKEEIDKSATLFYNGDRMSFDNADLICPDIGTVTLIDNDSDNEIEVINVWSYSVMVVETISNTSLYDKVSGIELKLDKEDADYDYVIYRNGKIADFKDIRLMDVVLYAQSKNNAKNIKKILVSNKVVNGEIKSIDDNFLIVDNKEFNATDDVLNQVKVTYSGDFYLDNFDNIVYYSSNQEWVYGYLNEITLKHHSDETVYLKIFTENNRWVKLPLTEKIKLNDSTIKASAFYENYGCLDKTEYRQLVRYRVDDEGNVKALNFAKDITQATPVEEKSAVSSNIFRKYLTLGEGTFRTAMNSFGNVLLLADNAKIFCIPPQKNGIDASTDNFSVVTPSMLVTGKAYKEITAYDQNESYQVSACVIEDEVGSKVDGTSKLVIVRGTIEMWDDKEEAIITGLKCICAESEITIPVKNTDEMHNIVAGLAKGSIIQIAFNTKGYVDNIDVVYDAKEGYEQKFLVDNVYASTTKIGGKILYYNPTTNVIKVDYGTVGFFNTKNLKTVYKYDKDENVIEIGTKEDVVPNKFICAYVKNFLVEEIVVFEE